MPKAMYVPFTPSGEWIKVITVDPAVEESVETLKDLNIHSAFPEESDTAMGLYAAQSYFHGTDGRGLPRGGVPLLAGYLLVDTEEVPKTLKIQGGDVYKGTEDIQRRQIGRALISTALMHNRDDLSVYVDKLRTSRYISDIVTENTGAVTVSGLYRKLIQQTPWAQPKF